MAKFTINAGGQKYGLTLPDDATQEQITAASDDFMRNLPVDQKSPPSSSAAPAAPATDPKPDTSLVGALGHGLHETVGGFGATGQVVGAASGQKGLQDAGKSLEASVGDARGYQPTDIAGSLRKGDFVGAIGQLPRAAAEAAPDLGGTLAAAGAGGMVAGPLGAAAGAGLYTAGRMFGRNAQSAAEANHNAPEDNLVRAGLVTAGQSALGAVGLGKTPGLTGALERMSALPRSAAKVGLEATSGAAQDAAGQIGNTVGTQDGTKFDPYQSAAAGLQAGTARAAGEAAPLAKAGTKAGSDAIMSRAVEQPTDLVQAKSMDRVANAADAVQATDPKISRLQALNSVKTEHVQNIVETIVKARDAGIIAPSDFRALKAVVENQAQRHNNTISEGANGVSTLFDAVQKLDLPEEFSKPLIDSIQDLNTASTQSFAKNQTGPMQMLGTMLGRAGSTVGLLAGGDIVHAGIAAVTGHGIGPTLGRVVGKGLDNVLGTATPKVDLQAIAARRMLRKAGEESGPSPLQALQNVRAGLDDRANADIEKQAQDTKNAQLDAIKTRFQAEEAMRQRRLDADQKEIDRVQTASDRSRSRDVDRFVSGKTPTDDIQPQGDWKREYGAFAADQDFQRRDAKRVQGVADDAGAAQAKGLTDAQKRVSQAQADSAASSEREDAAFSKKNDLAARTKARQIAAAYKERSKVTDEPVITDATVAKATSQIDDYLNGISKLPAEAPTGPTRAELSANDQRLRNLATQASARSRTQKAFDKARNGTVEAQAQARVDKLTKSHDVTLAADGLAPSNATGTVSEAATTAKSAVAADGVRAWGEQGAGSADRIAVGLPPTDPVAVDGLTPPRPRAPGSRVKAPKAPQASQDEATAASKPNPVVAPQETTQPAQGSSFAGVKAKSTAHEYIERGMKQEVSHEDFEKAVRGLQEKGTYTPEEAHTLLTEHRGIDNLSVGAKPLKEALRAQKAKEMTDVGLPAEAESGPIRHPEKWRAARSTAITHANDKIETARRAGNEEMATALTNARDEKTTAGKNRIAEAYIKDNPDHADLARRLFSGLMMKGR